MRRALVTAAIVGALFGGWAIGPASAQDGIVIENNGVSNSDSARGADNVNISRANGNSSSNNGAGANNEVRRVDKEPRERKDRGNRNNDGGGEVAPAEGDYQAYTEGSEWVDPATGEGEFVAEAPVEDAVQVAAPIQLPNTGSGATDETLPFALIGAGLVVAVLGTETVRRRIFE